MKYRVKSIIAFILDLPCEFILFRLDQVLLDVYEVLWVHPVSCFAVEFVAKGFNAANPAATICRRFQVFLDLQFRRRL